MTFTATRVTAKDLQPGDCFSSVGPEYWETTDRPGRFPESIGEKVYVRTDTPCPLAQRSGIVYRITWDT
jgi:hypothetical protein